MDSKQKLPHCRNLTRCVVGASIAGDEEETIRVESNDTTVKVEAANDTEVVKLDGLSMFDNGCSLVRNSRSVCLSEVKTSEADMFVSTKKELQFTQVELSGELEKIDDVCNGIVTVERDGKTERRHVECKGITDACPAIFDAAHCKILEIAS